MGTNLAEASLPGTPTMNWWVGPQAIQSDTHAPRKSVGIGCRRGMAGVWGLAALRGPEALWHVIGMPCEHMR